MIRWSAGRGAWEILVGHEWVWLADAEVSHRDALRKAAGILYGTEAAWLAVRTAAPDPAPWEVTP